MCGSNPHWCASRACETRACARAQTGATPLMCAASEGCLGSVRSLVAAGGAVDAENNDGKTALQAAAADGRMDLCNLLLEAGADVNHRDKVRSCQLKAAQLMHTRSGARWQLATGRACWQRCMRRAHCWCSP